VLAIAGIFVYGFFTVSSILWLNDSEGRIFVGHFSAMVGLPMAAALAFIIVLLLPASYGRIEFKVAGMTFTGASGPVVLWLLCFLGIAPAIKLTW